VNVLSIAIIIFVVIECLNIMTLYFNPSTKMGNGLGVFNAYHDSQENDKYKDLVSYLVNWVAGTKLIFIMIGIVVVVFGNERTQFYTVLAFIISILSFYWRLFPTIKELDKKDLITPKGYSKTLNMMIISFLSLFTIALLIHLIT